MDDNPTEFSKLGTLSTRILLRWAKARTSQYKIHTILAGSSGQPYCVQLPRHPLDLQFRAEADSSAPDRVGQADVGNLLTKSE